MVNSMISATLGAQNIITPSGTILSVYDQNLIWCLYQAGFVTRDEKEIMLKSGRSHIYVHGREDLSDNIVALQELGKAIARYVRKELAPLYDIGARHIGLIGVPTAATKLVQAAAMLDKGMPRKGSLFFRSMRTEKKHHGTNQTWIDGAPDLKRHFYIGLENVVTTSGSLIEAAKRMREDGYPVEQMPFLIVVDRGKDTVRSLEAAGINNVHVMYTLADIAYAMAYTGRWPQSYYDEAAREIE